MIDRRYETSIFNRQVTPQRPPPGLVWTEDDAHRAVARSYERLQLARERWGELRMSVDDLVAEVERERKGNRTASVQLGRAIQRENDLRRAIAEHEAAKRDRDIERRWREYGRPCLCHDRTAAAQREPGQEG